MRTQQVDCTLGQVLDISASGMRVYTLLRPPKPGSRVALTIDSLDGPVDVGCGVAWTRRVGMFKHEVGLEFIDLPDFVRAALTRRARATSQNEVIRPSLEEFRNVQT